MLAPPDSLVDKHARYVLTPWSVQGAKPPVIVSARGSRLTDSEGKEYVDLSAGLVAVNLGHSHPRVAAAIAAQAQRVCFSPPSWGNDGRAELAERLIELAGWPNGGRVFFTTGGADANDDAVKMIRMITGRPKVMTAYRSFHGSNSGAGTLTGENRRWAAEPGVPGIVRFFAPFPYRSPFFTRNPDEEVERALAHVEAILSYEDASRVGAILIEPVVGSNGVIVYPEGYLAGLREICNRYGIALIFDEVMTGFGRTGAAFAKDRFGVQPDVIIFAKGVTSAYVPLGGVMLREELAHYFDDHMMWAGHTYSGHPLAVAAGVATVDTYRDERIFERAAGLEKTIRSGLETIAKSHPVIGEVRGVGAFFALELVKDRETREPLIPWQGAGMGPLPTFLNGLRSRGAYAFGRYNCIVISPPLTIEKADLDQGFAALDGALGDLEKAVASGS